MTATSELRFVERDGKKILQQKWLLPLVFTEQDLRETAVHNGKPWPSEWRDVPVEKEEKQDFKQIGIVSLDTEKIKDLKSLDDIRTPMMMVGRDELEKKFPKEKQEGYEHFKLPKLPGLRGSYNSRNRAWRNL